MFSKRVVLLVAVIVLSAVPAIARFVDHTHSLEQRFGDHDRCEVPLHAVTKLNDTGPTTNGCGTGIFAGELPKEELFDECCNAHDRCYGECEIHAFPRNHHVGNPRQANSCRPQAHATRPLSIATPT